MKETFRCPHGIVEILLGSGHKVYCPECKAYLISDEEIAKEEMKLNKKEQK